MNIVAIILFILQAVSFYGNYVAYGTTRNGTSIYIFGVLPGNGIPFFLGQLFPTILGIICLIIHGKLQKRKYTTYYCETCEDVVARPRISGACA